ncbi:hypothetical protein Ae201684P_011661 [Aphanomyces euteiches]|nr:hypothetical protein Ae201684P_011661 [Aphanomyces euteiches]
MTTAVPFMPQMQWNDDLELEFLPPIDEDLLARFGGTASDSNDSVHQITQKQLELKLKALREHEHLRAILVEQTALQRELESVVFKKPRLMMIQLDDEQWRLLKLVLSAHGGKRAMEIQSIANRQLETVESDMLALGLIDCSERLDIVRHVDFEAYSEGVRSAQFQAASFAEVEKKLWRTVVQLHSNVVAHDEIQKQSIDAKTLLVRKSYAIPKTKTKLQSNLIMKMQRVGPKAARVVVRSILDDEANPLGPESIAFDNYGWVHVEESADGVFTYMSYMRGNFSVLKNVDMDNMVEFMSAL